MELKEVLKQLCTAIGVAGDEAAASDVALNMLKDYTEDCATDSFGNVIGYLKKDENKPTLLLDAHIDSIGMIVTYIDDGGYIKAMGCGGIDKRTMAAQTVTIHGKRDIKGMVSVLPPHVKGEDKHTDYILIDTGYSKEELEKIVSLGDRITVDSEFCELLNGRISAPAIDDRSGVASILYALELMKGKALKYNIAVSFTVQEETGGAGAAMIGYRIQPDIMFEMDVSFATTPDVESYKCGEMTKGVQIGIAPSLSRRISNELIDLAKQKEIPYQIEVMGSTTGTNADEAVISAGGVAAVTLSIPIRYMHTAIETVDITDIESTARLIAAYCIDEGGDR